MKRIGCCLAAFLFICICALVGNASAQQSGQNSDVAWFVQLVKTHNGKEFCAPDSTSFNQLTASVGTFLKAHGSPPRVTDPEVIEALSESYPCKGGAAAANSAEGRIEAGRAASGSSPIARSVNIDAPGNLEPVRQLPCLELSAVKNSYNPADLQTSVKACIKDGEFDKASRVFAIAGLFARFDAARVADPTARDAGQMLILQTFSSIVPDAKKKFGDAYSAMVKDPQSHGQLCSEAQRIGAPTYFPGYMIAHGMSALTSSANRSAVLLSNFNASETWVSLQASYLMCTKKQA
jgi:hypothetical protein